MKGWRDYFHYNFALLFLTFTFYLSWCWYGTTFLINLVSTCLSVSSLLWPELSVNLITKLVLFCGMMGLVTVCPLCIHYTAAGWPGIDCASSKQNEPSGMCCPKLLSFWMRDTCGFQILSSSLFKISFNPRKKYLGNTLQYVVFVNN